MRCSLSDSVLKSYAVEAALLEQLLLSKGGIYSAVRYAATIELKCFVECSETNPTLFAKCTHTSICIYN